MKLINVKNEYLISVREIYFELGITKQFSEWIKYGIEKAMLEENTDFITIMGKSSVKAL
jgi:phage anti-repressor protein